MTLVFALFYRYRVGDIVKVVGFHNQCPVVEFQYRYVWTRTFVHMLHVISRLM